MKSIKLLTIFALSLFILIGCQVSNDKNQETDPFLKDLTPIQLTMVEDYEYFWDFAENNFAIMAMVQRNGFDKEEIYETYKLEIKKCEDYHDFNVFVMEKIAMKFKQSLEYQTMPFTDEWYSVFLSVFDYYDEALRNHDYTMYTQEHLELTNEGYEFLADILEGSKNYYEREDIKLNTSDQNFNFIEYKIIEEDEIAYIRFYQMIASKKEQEKLVEFLNKVAHYPNLIIDIRGNNNGEEFVISPIFDSLASETYEFETTFVSKSSENNNNYLNATTNFFNEALPITDNVLGEQFNSDDLNTVDQYFKSETKIEFNEELYNGFDGEIYLLVDEDVYGNSDSFAYVCKKTQFATVVGKTNTAGYGIAIYNNAFMLPNSEIVWLYTDKIGLNPDGSSNIEFGTTPDIIVPSDIGELDYVIELIG